jgi:hypothetical protein
MSKALSVTWEIPIIAQTDVCVVGGGSAGVAAAIAASRAGAQTILVEQLGILGGTATAGLVGPMMTSYSSDGSEPVIAGIFRDIVNRMVALGGAIDPSQVESPTAYGAFIKVGHARVTPFHPEALKLATIELVQESGARMMFHTRFVRVMIDQKQITGIVIHNKTGLGVIEAKTFVDTTGDADVAVDTGVPYKAGRVSDGKMMPATMFMRLGNVDDSKVEAYARAHPNESLFESIVQKARKEGRWDIPREYLNLYREPSPGEYRANITRLLGIDGTNPDDLSRAEIEGREQCLKVFRFMKENCPGLENARLLETAAMIGIRETRHIEGLYTLTAEDVLTGRRFPDAIARCAYPIDIHDPVGTRGLDIALGDKFGKSSKEVQAGAPSFYDIPYRCLVPKGIDNLLVAGRPISATHEAAGSARVIPPCYAIGQAAGLAAALSVELSQPCPRLNTDILREKLAAQGAII